MSASSATWFLPLAGPLRRIFFDFGLFPCLLIFALVRQWRSLVNRLDRNLYARRSRAQDVPLVAGRLVTSPDLNSTGRREPAPGYGHGRGRSPASDPQGVRRLSVSQLSSLRFNGRQPSNPLPHILLDQGPGDNNNRLTGTPWEATHGVPCVLGQCRSSWDALHIKLRSAISLGCATAGRGRGLGTDAQRRTRTVGRVASASSMQTAMGSATTCRQLSNDSV